MGRAHRGAAWLRWDLEVVLLAVGLQPDRLEAVIRCTCRDSCKKKHRESSQPRGSHVKRRSKLQSVAQVRESCGEPRAVEAACSVPSVGAGLAPVAQWQISKLLAL